MTQQIRAITFDLFGTLTEAPPRDADHWLNRYAAEVHAITRGEKPWRPIGEIFDEVGADWSDLRLRPGVRESLVALDKHETLLLRLLSNAGNWFGHEIIEQTGLPINVVIPTEHVRAYKPDRRIYYCTIRQFEHMDPSRILHVAAHAFDLRGAKAMGFKTAYLRWPGYLDEEVAAGEFDYVETSLGGLADRLLGEPTS